MGLARTEAASKKPVLRRQPRFVSKLLAAAFAVVFVTGTLLGGIRYFYCPSMGESQFTSCCPAHEGEAGSETAELVTKSCCESKVMQDLPAAQVDGRPIVATAPLLAVLSVAPPPELHTARPIPRPPARWGSDPPTPSEARPRLMVFLI